MYEDTPCVFEELVSVFSSEVVDVIRFMTHSVERLSNDRIARMVKINDFKHNSDESRLNNITVKEIKRNLKFKNL